MIQQKRISLGMSSPKVFAQSIIIVVIGGGLFAHFFHVHRLHDMQAWIRYRVNSIIPIDACSKPKSGAAPQPSCPPGPSRVKNAAALQCTPLLGECFMPQDIQSAPQRPGQSIHLVHNRHVTTSSCWSCRQSHHPFSGMEFLN